MICLEATDRVPSARLESLDDDGTWRPIEEAERGTQTSDARALADGGYRYLRWNMHPPVRTTLVEIAPDGTRRERAGGAPRPVLLGGRSHHDPSSPEGNLRAEASYRESPPWRVTVYDTTVSELGGEGCLDSEGCVELDTFELEHATGPPRVLFVADDGASFGAVVSAASGGVVHVRERGGPTLRLELPGILVAHDATLDRFAASTALGGLIVARGTSVEGPAGRWIAGAFHPCDETLWVLRSLEQGRDLVVVAPDGTVQRNLPVPEHVREVTLSPDGAFAILWPDLAESQEPAVHTALLVSTATLAYREVEVPDDTVRVVVLAAVRDM